MSKKALLILLSGLLTILIITCTPKTTEPDDDDDSTLPPVEITGYTNMIDVPAGRTLLSNTDPTPQTTLDLQVSAFAIGQYEVTYELWYVVIKWAAANGYYFEHLGKEGNHGSEGSRPTSAKYQPVTTVSWCDVVVWCNAYSEMSGLVPCYRDTGYSVIRDSTDGNISALQDVRVYWRSNGYRLPTDGEWQYAAGYIDGTNWTPCSNASGSATDTSDTTANTNVAWYETNANDTTYNVGTLTANQLGAYDMSGNVSEWCWDWKEPWPAGLQVDYTGPASKQTYDRIYRGGNYFNGPGSLQIGNRGWDVAITLTKGDTGFRVVQSQ